MHLPGPVARIVGVDYVAYCAEEWGNKYSNGRLIYSIFIFIVQVELTSGHGLLSPHPHNADPLEAFAG